MPRYVLVGSVFIVSIAIILFFFSRDDHTNESQKSILTTGDSLQKSESPIDEGASRSNSVRQESTSTDQELTVSEAGSDDDTFESSPIFSEPPVELQGALEQWLSETYLASHDMPEMVIRTNFVSVDTAEFKDRFMSSLSSKSHGSTRDRAAVQLDVFPDRSYSLVTYRYRMGSGGHSNIGARVVDSGGLGNENFGFQISPDGRISGWGTTSTGRYSIEPTPEVGVILVVETNPEVVRQRAIVN